MAVILVEDDAILRMVLSDMLEDAGCAALCYGTADATLRALMAEPYLADGRDPTIPDLLITDIRLGGPIDGFGLAARLRRRWPDLAVIYISGIPVSPALLASTRDRALAKPFGMDALVTALDQLCIRAARHAA